jgi:hypothetical protein
MVHESEAALGELAFDVELVDPPPALRDRIRQATGAADAIPPRAALAASAPTPIRRPERFRWAVSALAAAAAVVMVLGWNVVLQQRVHHQQQLAAQRQTVISALAQSTTRAALHDSRKRTVAYVVQRGSAMSVVSGAPAVDGLPPNDAKTTTYVLWAIQGANRPPLPVGTFDVGGTLEVRPVRDAQLHPGVTSFAISREPGRSVPARPSDVVATGSVQG